MESSGGHTRSANKLDRRDRLIDLETWERQEFYEHFINDVVCTYSAVVNIDITNLKGMKGARTNEMDF